METYDLAVSKKADKRKNQAAQVNTDMEAMASLSPAEVGFVRDVLAGSSYMDAFRKNFPEVIKGRSAPVQAQFCSKLKLRPRIKKAMALMKEAASIEAGVDASWILKESKRLYEKCIVDDDNATARQTLELIGKNKLVDAFAQKRISHELSEMPTAVNFNISFDTPRQAQPQPQAQPVEHQDSQALPLTPSVNPEHTQVD